MSQAQLAADAECSTRHLSCLETGKAQPSRHMVLVLSSALELDLDERNALLASAGYPAAYPADAEVGLSTSPAREAFELLLVHWEPFPSLVVDRCFNVQRANLGARRLLHHFGVQLRANLAKDLLHPEGLRPFIVNWPEVAALMLRRLEREVSHHPEDGSRRRLVDEVRAYAGVSEAEAASWSAPHDPVAVVHLRKGTTNLRLLTLLTTLGTPLDATADSLVIESFSPCDAETEAWFRSQALEAQVAGQEPVVLETKVVPPQSAKRSH